MSHFIVTVKCHIAHVGYMVAKSAWPYQTSLINLLLIMVKHYVCLRILLNFLIM